MSRTNTPGMLKMSRLHSFVLSNLRGREGEGRVGEGRGRSDKNEGGTG